MILKKASSKGPARLEKYQDEKTASINKFDPKSIFLSDVRSVSMLPSDIKKHTFVVSFNNGSKQYCAESGMYVFHKFSFRLHEVEISVTPPH